MGVGWAIGGNWEVEGERIHRKDPARPSKGWSLGWAGPWTGPKDFRGGPMEEDGFLQATVIFSQAAVERSDEGVYTCNLHHHYCHLYESLAVRLEVTDDRECAPHPPLLVLSLSSLPPTPDLPLLTSVR